jgi:hypothetical protein
MGVAVKSDAHRVTLLDIVDQAMTCVTRLAVISLFAGTEDLLGGSHGVTDEAIAFRRYPYSAGILHK